MENGKMKIKFHNKLEDHLYNYEIWCDDSVVEKGVLSQIGFIEKDVAVGDSVTIVKLRIKKIVFKKDNIKKVVAYIIFYIFKMYMSEDINPYEYLKVIKMIRQEPEMVVDIEVNEELMKNEGNGILFNTTGGIVKESFLELHVDKKYIKQEKKDCIGLALILGFLPFLMFIDGIIQRNISSIKITGSMFGFFFIMAVIVFIVGGKREKLLFKEENKKFRD